MTVDAQPGPAAIPGSVSVIIPAFNAAATIGRTIRSALAQTRPALEILVVDDGSTDDTAQVVAEFGPAVRLISKPNGGPASARNMAAAQARGEWLGMLDADDVWLPDKLERQLPLGAPAEVGIVHALASHLRHRVPDRIGLDALWDRNYILNSAVLVRRDVFAALGGLNEDRALVSVEDYNLWLRIAAAGWQIVTCQEVLIDYTRGQGLSSQSPRFLAASLANADDIARRLGLTEARLRSKRQQILEQFGRSAMFERRLGDARALLGRAYRTRPSLPGAIAAGASFLPTPLLDAKRHAAGRLGTPGKAELFGKRVELAELGSFGPFLLVVVDAEEEFDWAVVPSRGTQVESMRQQGVVQRIFEQHGVVPTYAIDYPVASQPDGFKPLLEFLADGQCEIGAQLHPWLNPPIREALTPENSFAGNLDPALEAEKLTLLTRVIGDNLGVSPILYRAGRYGLGRSTGKTLVELGYKVDCSVRSLFNLRPSGGPDYSDAPVKPFWLDGERTLLEIPVTTGMTGVLPRQGKAIYPAISGRVGRAASIPGLLARSGLLNRVQLTPEGSTLAEAKQVTRQMMARDQHQIFVLSYHSPSLVPGNTPYVQTTADRQRFQSWIEGYLDFFLADIGGVASTPAGIHRLASRLHGG